MPTIDPLQQAEEIVRKAHDTAGQYTQPVFRRYPLLFAFTFTFSLAAVLHGFELWADHVEFFNRHPLALMLIGVVALFLTGTLYKALNKVE